MPNIPVQDAVLFATYKMPIIHTTNKSMLLPGVKLRDPVFTPTEESIIRSKMNERRKHGNQNQNSLHGNNALGRNEHLKVPGRVGGFENFIGLEKAGQLSGSDLQTQQGFRGNFNSGSGQGYNSGYNGRGGYNNGPNNRGGYNRGGYNSRPNNRGGYNNQYNNRNNNYNNRGNNYNNHNGGGHNNNGYNQSSAPPYAQQNQYQPTAHMPFANNALVKSETITIKVLIHVLSMVVIILIKTRVDIIIIIIMMAVTIGDTITTTTMTDTITTREHEDDLEIGYAWSNVTNLNDILCEYIYVKFFNLYHILR